MTARKNSAVAATAAAETPMEQPAAGGSYVRQGDGSLTRVEHTAERAEPDDTTPSAPVAGDDQAEG